MSKKICEHDFSNEKSNYCSNCGLTRIEVLARNCRNLEKENEQLKEKLETKSGAYLYELERSDKLFKEIEVLKERYDKLSSFTQTDFCASGDLSGVEPYFELGNLRKENEELKAKISKLENYLKKVAECDSCIHRVREAELCDYKCEYQFDYEGF